MKKCTECNELYDAQKCDYCAEQAANYFHSDWLLGK